MNFTARLTSTPKETPKGLPLLHDIVFYIYNECRCIEHTAVLQANDERVKLAEVCLFYSWLVRW